MTMDFAISRRRTSAVSTAMSAIAARMPNSISIWGSPTTSWARRRPRRSSCCSNIGVRPTRRRRPPTNQVAYANLTGKVDVTPTWTVETVAHVRAFNQQTVDGNPTGTQPCAADATLLCFGDDSTPANGLNGMQLANPFAPMRFLGEIDRTTTRSTTGGFSAQATNTDEIFGHGNRFVVGASIDVSVTQFQRQCRTRDDRLQLRRQRQRHLPRAIRQSRLDRSGVAARHQPIYRPLCARHFRRHQGLLDHRRRPFQRCAHRVGGPDRHPAQRQFDIRSFQPDHRRDLQDHIRS